MINKVFLVGRLGGKPEIKPLKEDKKVATVSVATWESFYDEATQKWETTTEWHSVVVWGDQTKRLEKMNKGENVVVEGKIRTRSWEDKEGVTHSRTEIVGIIKSLPKPKDGATSAEAPQEGMEAGQVFPNASDGEDDLPI